MTNKEQTYMIVQLVLIIILIFVTVYLTFKCSECKVFSKKKRKDQQLVIYKI
jgi:hypothetical protein